MACYVLPLAASVVHYGLMKKGVLSGKRQSWLGLMFLGGALFGVVDHAWNRELLSVSVSDMLLGTVITAVILLGWAAVVLLDKLRFSEPARVTEKI